MKKYNWEKESVSKAVQVSDNFTEVLRNLNIPVQGNNLSTLKRKIKEFEISTEHFTFTKQYNAQRGFEKDVSEYLVKGSYIKSYALKQRLISSGLKLNKCECCGIDSWNNKPLMCQLHHINGDNTDNRLENLQILCPNCHSQTDSYCGAANKRKHYYCIDCWAEITSTATRCVKCSRISKIKPSKDNLLLDFINLHSFLQVAKKYSVTDNAVRRWCKSYNLPIHTKELQKFLKEQESQ